LSIALPAQTFTPVLSFNGIDGSHPLAGLIQGKDGNLYGTTLNGGTSLNPSSGGGTLFKVTPQGAITTLYRFCPSLNPCPDGEFSEAAVVQAKNGDLYGTTSAGGTNTGFMGGGAGTIFSFSPSGTLTSLYSFCAQSGCTDGETPYAGLIQASDGSFYGTAEAGGANCVPYGGCGTVFKINAPGKFTTLYGFCAQSLCTDGSGPLAGLVQARNGDFFGTTGTGGANTGGAYGYGTVFKITSSGKLTTLYSFCNQSGCTDGANPGAGLVQAANGDFYGTTEYGGYDNGGTVFKIGADGTLTTLYTFCAKTGCEDGKNPFAGLIQTTDGNLYGTTYYGGASGYGTVFRITPAGQLTTFYSFCAQSGCTDGSYPNALMEATNGKLYGTTQFGGIGTKCFSVGCGTVFSVSAGLSPFVKPQPATGIAGASIEILGTNLTGASSVTFNGTPAIFNVNSPSEITATVPTGATTGTVQVVTPSATLSSNVPFQVLP
jgi:uncharacterized repeat protein (TIGR03803 family)